MKKYHYTECGLKNIYLVNGFNVTKNSAGEEEIYIQNIHGLHKMIGMSLISKPGLLLGNEIKFIRHTMDLTQTALARFLGVNYQSVLGWEKNKVSIPKTADHLLKAIFSSYLKQVDPIYDLINEIANLCAEQASEKPMKIFMGMNEQEWRCVDKKAA